MKKTTFVGALAVPLLMVAFAIPSYADSTCKDGSTSTATGKGACSGHGGVQKAAKAAAATTPAAATAAAAPAAAAPAATPAPAAKAADATGATAKCKDGSYSKSKSHAGACSKHGGVEEFIPASK